jgi:hypothetical protein
MVPVTDPVWKQYWKAILAFLAPGVILLGEGVLSENLTGNEVRRALLTAVVTSVIVYAKKNGKSADETTSTPQV